jgi:two-component system chemotaxis response regulator CheB
MDVIRVLIAEDSAVTREYLVYLLAQDPDLQVVGTARDGLEAVAQAERLKPDVILMDVHMPRLNGYEATRQIMERVPTPIVMISASSSRDEAAMAFRALQAGAVTLVDKPRGPDHPAQAETTRRLLKTVKLMAEVKVVRRWAKDRGQGSGAGGQGELTVSRPRTPIPCMDRKIRLIAIGASTGGPQVLAEILGRLPGDIGVPILVVQHITPGFTAGLADWLTQATRLTVKLAQPDEVVRRGTVYLAPDCSQMEITQEGRIHLTEEVVEGGLCPSASYLFQSVAETYGRSAIGVLLTGMGRDGAEGLRRLREAGGLTIAQDEESSIVFGMPGEAIRVGAAEYALSPEQIAELIRSTVTSGATSHQGSAISAELKADG